MSNPFVTIFTSNTPIECHILRGRLLSDGIQAFVFDENMVWVHPFRAVAIGGVRLCVLSDNVVMASKILSDVNKNRLTDEQGEYETDEALSAEIIRQNEILKIKVLLWKKPNWPEKPEIKSTILSSEDIQQLLNETKKFFEIKQKKFTFTWQRFWYELFDFDRDFFSYLCPRPSAYYLEEELIHNFNKLENESSKETACPVCHSNNIVYGHALNFRWDFAYLILSLLLMTPLPPFRKAFHCFDCGKDFKRRELQG